MSAPAGSRVLLLGHSQTVPLIFQVAAQAPAITFGFPQKDRRWLCAQSLLALPGRTQSLGHTGSKAWERKCVCPRTWVLPEARGCTDAPGVELLGAQGSPHFHLSPRFPLTVSSTFSIKI